jgi:plastocyanin
VVLEDASKAPIAVGGDTSPFQGPDKRSYAVPALKAGSYTYICQVHPSTMTGTLEVK